MDYSTILQDNAIISNKCSYEENNNTIRINKGTILASKAVKYRCYYGISKKNKMFVSSLLDEYKVYSGCKRIGAGIKKSMACVLANMVFSNSIDKSVIYQRSNFISGVKPMNDIVEFMANKGYLINIIGKANEYEKNSSWFAVTNKFNLDTEREKIKVVIVNDGNFLVLRDDQGNETDVFKNKNNALTVKRLSASVNLYNQLWLDHDATLNGKHIIPFNFRIFNKELNLGGRFYRGSYQGLPKSDRGHILINGEQTIEPDYSSLHYNILYAWSGIQLESDPYVIDGYSRKTIKIASFVLLNCDSLARFKANITKSGNPSVKSAYSKWKSEYCIDNSKEKPDYLNGFIEGMPDNIQGSDLLASLQVKHSSIAHYFGSKDIGLKLQFADSEIMASVLLSLSSLNIPVLPVHDSVICRKFDEKTVKFMLQQSYKQYTGYNISI